MKAPGTPLDETQRLAALHRLGLLDTPATESLDRVTRLAAKVLHVPTLLISLVDSDRQWFKSCVGLDATQTSREVSFCGHVVFERRPLVIRDATLDPRFADNPLVVGAPYIRAYMGVPLNTLDGQPIGTLCAIDSRPHDFDADELETLTSFAQIVEEFLHAKELSAQTERVVEFARERDARFRETFELAAELLKAQSELEELNAKLRHDSTTDYLTGVANRKVFTERSEEAARQLRERGAAYGLILLDVDNFKDINDHFGHESGDRVLVALGRVLREQLRGGSDIAARLGGEEFAVLCFGRLDEDGLRQLAERIRAQIKAETVHTDKEVVGVTCSFGVALSNADDGDWKGLYSRADAALYEAKTSGKDKVVVGNAIGKGLTGRFRSLRVAPNH